jgi:hypothetical protein
MPDIPQAIGSSLGTPHSPKKRASNVSGAQGTNELHDATPLRVYSNLILFDKELGQMDVAKRGRLQILLDTFELPHKLFLRNWF